MQVQNRGPGGATATIAEESALSSRPLTRPAYPRLAGRLRVGILGESATMSLRTLVGSAPGFAAPQSFDRPYQLRDFTGSVLVVQSNDPPRAVSAVLDHCPAGPAILVITDVRDPDIAIETLRRGASSYLVAAECSRDEFLFSLVGTANRHSSMSPSVTTALVRRFHMQAPRRLEDGLEDLLTPRDEAILALLAEGCSNLQIAGRLCLAEKTIRNYISRLYTKLDVGSRAEAIVWWLHRHAV